MRRSAGGPATDSTGPSRQPAAEARGPGTRAYAGSGGTVAGTALQSTGPAASAGRPLPSRTGRDTHEPRRAGAAGAAPRRVLILGGDADHNLGDHAILAALCHTLARLAPGIAITVVSADPARGSLPGVVDVLPPGFGGVPRQLRAARAQDLVLIGGGGLLQDDDSRVKMPYWAARLALLSRANPRVHAHALGAGPLRHPESRRLARFACRTLQSVSVRDPFAHGWLAPLSPRPVRVVPDPAFMLPPADPEAADRHLRQVGTVPGRPVIGVAMRRWFHRLGGVVPHRLRARAGLDRGHGAESMDNMLEQVATALRVLMDHLDADVLLMPTYNVAHEADLRQCEALAGRLPAGRVHTTVIDDPHLYKAVCGRLRLMVSARMHPLILAAGMGVPIVGLSYNGKFEGLFDVLGLPRRLIGLNEFHDGALAPRLLSLAHDALADAHDLRGHCARLADAGAAELAAVIEPRVAATGGVRP